jgi:hypothetical protein
MCADTYPHNRGKLCLLLLLLLPHVRATRWWLGVLSVRCGVTYVMTILTKCQAGSTGYDAWPHPVAVEGSCLLAQCNQPSIDQTVAGVAAAHERM